MADVSPFWDTNMAAETSCENTLLNERNLKCKTVKKLQNYRAGIVLFSSDLMHKTNDKDWFTHKICRQDLLVK